MRAEMLKKYGLEPIGPGIFSDSGKLMKDSPLQLIDSSETPTIQK